MGGGGCDALMLVVICISLATLFGSAAASASDMGAHDEWLADTPSYAQNSDTFIEQIKAHEASIGRQVFQWGSISDAEPPMHYAVIPAKVSPPALRIMVVAGMHAREPYTSELARIWMTGSMLYHNDSRRATDIEWIYVPVANPCGRDIVTSAYSKSHTRVGSSSSSINNWRLCKRTNCRGIDLNRNWITFEEQIYESHHVPGAHNKRTAWRGAPEENPGPEAFSESETRSIREIMSTHSPVDLLLSLHSGTAIVLVPPDGLSGFKPYGAAQLEMVGDWIAEVGCPRTRSSTAGGRRDACRSGSLPKVLRYTAEGTMSDYSMARGGVTAAYTLEVYSGWHHVNISELTTAHADYEGTEKWGNDPFDCFAVFNPHPKAILDASRSWVRLWRELYYMNSTIGHPIRETLIALRRD